MFYVTNFFSPFTHVGTRFSFLAEREGDKEQISRFYNACRGVYQVYLCTIKILILRKRPGIILFTLSQNSCLVGCLIGIAINIVRKRIDSLDLVVVGFDI